MRMYITSFKLSFPDSQFVTFYFGISVLVSQFSRCFPNFHFRLSISSGFESTSFENLKSVSKFECPLTFCN